MCITGMPLCSNALMMYSCWSPKSGAGAPGLKLKIFAPLDAAGAAAGAACVASGASLSCSSSSASLSPSLPFSLLLMLLLSEYLSVTGTGVVGVGRSGCSGRSASSPSLSDSTLF